MMDLKNSSTPSETIHNEREATRRVDHDLLAAGPRHPGARRPGARRPGALGRLLFRAPLALYRLNLGWLLGGRFLLLHHVGRKSGLPRRTVLEVVEHDRATGAYTVASGFGRGSQWFKNVQANPQVAVQVGPRRLEARAVVLSPDASAEKMVQYAHHYPTAARHLSRLLGFQADGSDDAYRQIARQHIPFVVFHPLRITRETLTLREKATTFLALLALLLILLPTLTKRRPRAHTSLN